MKIRTPIRPVTVVSACDYWRLPYVLSGLAVVLAAAALAVQLLEVVK